MSFIEFDYCKRKEFDAQKDGRLMVDEINVGSIYTTYIALKAVVEHAAAANREAFKFPSELLHKSRANEFGLHVVKFALLNPKDLSRVGDDSTMNLFDGLLADPTKKEFIVEEPDSRGKKYTYIGSQGFFVEYGGSGSDNEVDTDVADEIEEVHITTTDRELVLV